MIDLMAQRFVSLKHLEIFVLDEADRMLDMGFVHDVRRIIAVIPPQRQSLFFSATMPPEIVKLADTILVKPEKVEVTPVSSTVDIIQQSVFFVDKDNKNALLLHILEDKSIETALVFTRTKHGADKVVKVLLRHEIKAEAIHGNKSQNARQNALNNFKEKTTRVLVATDIAARGIDVDELAYVINFEIPEIPETYVHGLDARGGQSKAPPIRFVTMKRGSLKDIQKLIAKVIPVVEEHPFPLSQKPGNEAPKPHNVARGNRPSRPNSHTQNQSKPSVATADRDKKPWFKRSR